MKEDHKKSSMKVFDKWIAVGLGELGDKDITPNRKKKKNVLLSYCKFCLVLMSIYINPSIKILPSNSV